MMIKIKLPQQYKFWTETIQSSSHISTREHGPKCCGFDKDCDEIGIILVALPYGSLGTKEITEATMSPFCTRHLAEMANYLNELVPFPPVGQRAGMSSPIPLLGGCRVQD